LKIVATAKRFDLDQLVYTVSGSSREPFFFAPTPAVLRVRLRLAEADYFVAVFELTAFFQQLHSLKTFENVSLRCNRAGAFEASVL
jgi:hypothetical protein